MDTVYFIHLFDLQYYVSLFSVGVALLGKVLYHHVYVITRGSEKLPCI